MSVFYILFRIPAWLLSKSTNKVLGVKYEVRGKENIIHDSGCIVLINHQSMLDLGGKIFKKEKKNIYLF